MMKSRVISAKMNCTSTNAVSATRRLCVLNLNSLKINGRTSRGEVFSIVYHFTNDLKVIYDESVQASEKVSSYK
jgi:collagenase-like PrtC family protease